MAFQKLVTVRGSFNRIVDQRLLDSNVAYNYANEKRAQGYYVVVENA